MTEFKNEKASLKISLALPKEEIREGSKYLETHPNPSLKNGRAYY